MRSPWQAESGLYSPVVSLEHSAGEDRWDWGLFRHEQSLNQHPIRPAHEGSSPDEPPVIHGLLTVLPFL
jgi:hypothetical protein